jgi:hypothetical protein
MRLVPVMLIAAAAACGATLRAESSRSVIAPDSGLAPDAVHAVVNAHLPAIRACYELRAKAEGRPMGVARLAWTIEPSGAVTGVLVVATTLHSSAIESCIAEEVGRWQFPASPRATEVKEYPFTF